MSRLRAANALRRPMTWITWQQTGKWLFPTPRHARLDHLGRAVWTVRRHSAPDLGKKIQGPEPRLAVNQSRPVSGVYAIRNLERWLSGLQNRWERFWTLERSESARRARRRMRRVNALAWTNRHDCRFGRTNNSECARRVSCRDAASQSECTFIAYRGFEKTRQRFRRTKCAPKG